MRPALCLLLATSGCTLEDGAGWADARAGVAARLAGERTVETDQGFVVRLDALALTVDGVALYSAAAAGAGPATFDPADPPPGYTLCHGGHCHTSDGALESYDEIRAKLAGGAGQATEVLHGVLAGGGRLDVLAGARLALPEQPLGSVRVTSVAPRVRALDLEGAVTLGDEEVPVVVALAPDVPVPLREGPDAEGLPLSLGPDGPRDVELECEVEVGGALLDGVRWPNLARVGGAIRVDAETEDNHAAWELFLAKLAVLPVGVQARGGER